MSTQNTTRKRGAPGSGPQKSKSARCEDSAPTLNIQIWNLALEWLDPFDLARCSQVCKGWHQGINQHSWKQAATNVNPGAAEALKNAMQKMGKKLTGQAMAVGLGRLLKEEPVPNFPDPTLDPDDLFLLVELEAFDVKGSWCQSLSKCLNNLDDLEPLVMEFDEDVLGGSNTAFHVPVDRLDDKDPKFVLKEAMLLTLSMWRADTGQSFRFCVGQDCELENAMRDEIFEFNCFNTARPWANTDAGVVARQLCHAKGYNYLDHGVHVDVKPFEESCWLVEAQGADGSDSSSEADTAEHKFYLSRMLAVVGLKGKIRSTDNRILLRDFLLFVEGLDWK